MIMVYFDFINYKFKYNFTGINWQRLNRNFGLSKRLATMRRRIIDLIRRNEILEVVVAVVVGAVVTELKAKINSNNKSRNFVVVAVIKKRNKYHFFFQEYQFSYCVFYCNWTASTFWHAVEMNKSLVDSFSLEKKR